MGRSTKDHDIGPLVGLLATTRMADLIGKVDYMIVPSSQFMEVTNTDY